MERVKRKGQDEGDGEAAPAYRLLEELETQYLVEYCGIWKFLPKADYERVQP